MSEQRWLVIRCRACQQCSGQRRQGGRCPHCGSSMGADAEVVKVCESSTTLHIEVALANTPVELRDELRSRLSSAEGCSRTTGRLPSFSLARTPIAGRRAREISLRWSNNFSRKRALIFLLMLLWNKPNLKVFCFGCRKGAGCSLSEVHR